MANVSTGAMPLDDLGIDIGALDSKKKRALARLVDSMKRKSPLIDTGAIKLANWGEILGDVVRNYRANSELDEIEGEEKQLAGRLQERRSAGMKELSDAEYAQRMEEPAGPMPDGSNIPPVTTTEEAKSPEKLRKISALLAKTTDPTVAAAATERMKDIRKTDADFRMGVARNLQNAGPKTLQEANLDAAPKVHYSQEGLVRTTDFPDGSYTQEATRQLGPVEQATPGLPARQTDRLTGKTFPMAGGQLGTQTQQAFGEAKIKELTEGKKEAQKALVNGQQLTDMMARVQAISAKNFGPQAPVQNLVHLISSALGMEVDPNMVNMEGLNALTGQRLLEQIRLLAPVSDDDAKRLAAIIGSGRTNTKEGLLEVLNIAMLANMRKLQEHNGNVESLISSAKGKNLPGYDLADTYYVENWPKDSPNYFPGAFKFTPSPTYAEQNGSAASPKKLPISQRSTADLLKGLGR